MNTRHWFLGLMMGLCFSSSSRADGAVQVRPGTDNWTLENSRIRVTVELQPGRLIVLEKSSHRTWEQSIPTHKETVTQFRDPQAREAGMRFSTKFGTAHSFEVTLSLRPDKSDLHVTIDTDKSASIGSVLTFPPFKLDTPDAVLAVANYSNGHIYSLRGPMPIQWLDMATNDMPWAGICDLAGGYGYAVILETPDDAYMSLRKTRVDDHDLWSLHVGFLDSLKQWRTPRKFLYHFAPAGHYVALAKRYREYAREQGLLVSLAEKVKKQPHTARLFGAVDVWDVGSLAFAQEARAAGVEKMIIHGQASAPHMRAINELGYLTSNYDNYTDILPITPQQAIDRTHGRVPDDVVLQANGERKKAWLEWNGKQFMKRCPALWLPAARLTVPPLLARHPYLGRFVDVTTAEELYECHDPQHPLTRSEKRRCGTELFEYLRSLGLVLGGEHGRFWAVPQLDYIEGMMSGGSASWPSGHLLRPKSKDQKFTHPSGYQYPTWDQYMTWGVGHESRVPLWELVFHDCIVSTWYWGDSNDFLLAAAPEITPRKDAFNVLYGTIPMIWANKEGGWQTHRAICLRTIRNTCKLHEVLAGQEMLSHEFLSPDRSVQKTRFSDGTEVIVNFGAIPADVSLAGKTWKLPPNGFTVHGPKIDQSMAIVDGKTRIRIRTTNYLFEETLP